MKALLLLAAPLCASLSAQTVTATAVYQQPFVMTIVDAGGTPHTQTIAAGTSVNQPATLVSLNSVATINSTSVTNVPTAATLNLYQFALVGSGRSASLGPADVLCTLTATAPTAVVMQVQWLTNLPATFQAQLQIDIHNDGTFEYRANPSLSGATTALGRFTLGPTPLAVRITMQTSATAAFGSQRAILSVLPDSGATIQSSTLPCDTRTLQVLPAFDGTLQVSSPTPAFQVLVLGLTAQPTPLPLTATSPCLLIPAPDALLPMPPGSVSLVLPTQSLHGTPLWMQAIAIDGFLLPSPSVFLFLP